MKELAAYAHKIHKQYFGSIIERILVISDDEIFTIDTHGNSISEKFTGKDIPIEDCCVTKV